MNARSRLAGIDLNLLVALDALVAEESVTRAAARVGLSQPAMSHSLSRLRDLLDDRVLVRAGTRMRASTRARELARPVSDGLGAIERALFGADGFDLARVERRIRMATADFGQLVIVPPLAIELARVAPGVGLDVVPLQVEIERGILDGDVDLSLAVGWTSLRPALRGIAQTRLCDERFVCVVRKNHPMERLTLARYAALPHVVISPRGRVLSAGDTALAERNMHRNVVLTVPSFQAATMVVARSDAVLTVAERVARSLPRSSFRVLEPPLALERFALHLMWHERHERDELHAFVRSSIIAIAARV